MPEPIEEVAAATQDNNPPTDNTSVTADASDDSGDDTPVDRDLSNVSFAAFRDRREGKEAEGEAAETKEEVAKPEAPIAKPVVTKQPTAPKVIASKTKDFTGIDSADLPAFQHMSNESFAKLKPIYVENRQLKAAVAQLKAAPVAQTPAAPNHYTGHPEAYTLTDDFKSTRTAVGVASQVEEFLVTQLENIEKGEQWEGLTTDKDGNIFRAGTKSEPSERARWELSKQLRQVQDAKIGYERKLNEMSSGYTKTYEQDVQLLKATEEKYFPGYDKPEHPTYKAQEAFIALLPTSQRNNPLARTLAKTVANNSIFAKQRDEALAEITTLKAELAKYKTPGSNGQQPGKEKAVAGAAPTTGKVSYSEIKRRRETGEAMFA